MVRFVVMLCFLVMASATPLTRTKEQIEEVRSFLERVRDGNGPKVPEDSPLAALVNAEENSGRFQGDILLDDHDIEELMAEYTGERNAFRGTRFWPGNIVVWEIAEGHFNEEQEAAIWEGVRDIERHSCVRFRYREPADTVYVSITGLSGGCYANVGYLASRGVHTLNLQPNTIGVSCFRHATIVHEWLHILGFYHMQSTYDRDNYVRIVEENVIPTSLHNFNIYTSELITNHNVDYDYISCMHYTAYAFSANGEQTIVSLQEHEGNMGQRIFITDKDWLRLNRHYNCPVNWV